VGALDLSSFSTTMRVKLPSNVSAVVLSGDVYEITVGVSSGSVTPIASGELLRVAAGSELVVSGNLLQVAGWAWYAGFKSVELQYAGGSVAVTFSWPLPVATLAVKPPSGSWDAVVDANGVPVTWWVDPCELGLDACP